MKTQSISFLQKISLLKRRKDNYLIRINLKAVLMAFTFAQVLFCSWLLMRRQIKRARGRHKEPAENYSYYTFKVHITGRREQPLRTSYLVLANVVVLFVGLFLSRVLIFNSFSHSSYSCGRSNVVLLNILRSYQ